MIKYLSTFLLAVLLCTQNLYAIGGTTQAEMLCQKADFPGVVMIGHQDQIGTGLILPGSGGKLVLTAQHVTESVAADDLIVLMGNDVDDPDRIEIDVAKIYDHPTLDAAILELEEAFPVSDDQLPKFLTNFEEILDKNQLDSGPAVLSCQAVGFGRTNADEYSPNLIYRHIGENRKRKGVLSIYPANIPKNFDNFNSSGLDSGLRFYFSAENFQSFTSKPEEPNSKNYLAPSDSGGPLLYKNYLMGIAYGYGINLDHKKDQDKEKLINFLFNSQIKILTEDDIKTEFHDVDPVIKHEEDRFIVKLYWKMRDNTVGVFIQEKEGHPLDAKLKTSIENEVKNLLHNFEPHVNDYFKNDYLMHYHKLISEIYKFFHSFFYINFYLNIMNVMEWMHNIYWYTGRDTSPFEGFYKNHLKKPFQSPSNQIETARLILHYSRESDTLYKRTRVPDLPTINYRPMRSDPKTWAYRDSNFNLKDANISILQDIITIQMAESLDLRNTKVTDLEPINKLPFLRSLYLGGAPVSSLHPLKNNRTITLLDIGCTQVSDLTGIEGMQQLTNLWLNNTPISSLTPLSGLQNLTYLDVSDTSISSLEGIENLKNLTILNIASDRPLSLKPLQNLWSLRLLILSEAQGQSPEMKAEVEQLKLKRQKPLIVKYIRDFQDKPYDPDSFNSKKLDHGELEKTLELIELLPDDIFERNINNIVKDLLYVRRLSLFVDIDHAEEAHAEMISPNFLAELRLIKFNPEFKKLLIQKIAALTFLEKLCLANFELENLPSEFSALEKLHYLFLYSLNLENIDANVLSQLTKLEEIHIMSNPLRSLPKTIGRLVMLRKIDLSCTMLSSVPAEIERLKDSLESLNIQQASPHPLYADYNPPHFIDEGKGDQLGKLDLSRIFGDRFKR